MLGGVLTDAQAVKFFQHGAALVADCTPDHAARSEPVTLEMARLHTRAEAVEDDALLTVLITVARQQGEGVTFAAYSENPSGRSKQAP